MTFFPVTDEVVLARPKVGDAELELKIGDDVHIAIEVSIKKKSGERVTSANPLWGTVVECLEDFKHKIIITSPGQCDQFLKRGTVVIAKSEEIWSHHAPGSHARYMNHATLSNAKKRADLSVKTKGLCASPLTPCFIHEHEHVENFVDVRGCWRCGEKLPEDGDDTYLPSSRGAPAGETVGSKAIMASEDAKTAYKCGDCKRARYCKPQCADLDVFSHALTCTYWS